MKSLVGCCFQRTIKPNTHKIISHQKIFFALSEKPFFLPILFNGALANAPYGFLQKQEYYNLTYFSQKLFFNIKITKKP